MAQPVAEQELRGEVWLGDKVEIGAAQKQGVAQAAIGLQVGQHFEAALAVGPHQPWGVEHGGIDGKDVVHLTPKIKHLDGTDLGADLVEMAEAGSVHHQGVHALAAAQAHKIVVGQQEAVLAATAL